MKLLMGLLALISIGDTVYYEAPQETPQVVQIEVMPSQLARIADCESGLRDKNNKAIEGSATHFDENGNVKVGEWSTYTTDVGKYQIALEYHQETAESMGLDLMKEQDNEKYARYLYKKYGARPWSASKKCWL